MLAVLSVKRPFPSLPVTDLRPREQKPSREVLVLVVDDSEAFRYAIGRTLRHEGYQVLEASNGDEALEVMADNDVQGLVLDLVMPGLSGVELLRVLAQRKTRRPLHVVACTGVLPISDDLRHSLAAVGVKDILTKPFSTEQLLDAFGDRP